MSKMTRWLMAIFFLIAMTASTGFSHELFILDHSAYLDTNGKVTITAKLKRVEGFSQVQKVRFYKLVQVFDGGQLIQKLEPVDITLSLNKKATGSICEENYEVCLKERYAKGKRLIRALW